MANRKRLLLLAKAKAKAARERQTQPDNGLIGGVIDPTLTPTHGMEPLPAPEKRETTVAEALMPGLGTSDEIQTVTDPETGRVIRMPKSGGMFQPLQEIGGLMDASRKILGASFNRPEGATFIEALQDPNVGLTRQLKDAVDRQDSHAALKFIQKFGLEVAEDPLTWATGVIGLTKKASKGAIKALSNKLRKDQGISLSKGVTQDARLGRVSKLKGFDDTGKVAEDIAFTPGEKIAIEGTDAGQTAVEKVLKKETDIQTKAPEVFKELRKTRTEQLNQKLIDLQDDFSKKHGIGEGSVESLTRETAEKVVDASNRFHSEIGRVYDDIAKQIDEVGTVESSMIGELRKEMNRIGVGKAPRKAGTKVDSPKFLETGTMSADDYNKLVNGGFELGESTLADVLRQSTTKTTAKSISQLADEAGTSPALYRRIQKFDELVSKGAKYSDLHKFRKDLDIFYRKASKMDLPPAMEFEVIDDMRKTVTRVMEHQIQKSSPEVLAQFKEANKIYRINKPMFEKMRNIFAKTEGKGLSSQAVEATRSPASIMNKLAGQPLKEQGQMIEHLMRMNLGESANSLRNMYFNRIIRQAAPDGKVNPEKLINTLNKLDSSVYNRIFTDEMAAQIASLVKDGIAVKYANNINLLDKSSKPFLQAMKNIGKIGEWMMRGKAYRAAGMAVMPKLMAVEAGRQTVKNMMSKKAIKEATQYLKPVDPSELPGVFRKAFGYMTAGGRVPVGLGVTRKVTQPSE